MSAKTLAEPITLWCTGVYTKKTLGSGEVVDDQELMTCSACGAVVVHSHAIAHADSHAEDA